MATDDKVEACPICGWDARTIQLSDGVKVTCSRCGNFSMTRTLVATIGNPKSQHLRPYLSCYTRQANQQGTEAQLNSENWQDFARAHTGTGVSQKLMKALRLVADSSTHLGVQVEIDFEDAYPLVDATSSDELDYLLNSLADRNYLKAEAVRCYSVAVEGWERLEPISGGIPGRCFVAMSFDPSVNGAYQEGIYLAVKGCGFEPVRIDLVHHNEKICDKILAEIRSCQFMVADFTLQRAGVYFEAGFAMGLGRPVIWMCRKDDFENTHFDTRQYNHIVWETPQDLRENLADRIRATISR